MMENCGTSVQGINALGFSREMNIFDPSKVLDNVHELLNKDEGPAVLSDDDDWHSCVSQFSSDYNDFDANKYLSFIDYESDDSVESDAQESDVSIYYV